MPDITLLTPGRIDGFDTRNRMIMAPMTRSRAAAAEIPSELAIEYYAQRASAGLIITEGTAPTARGIGYARTPAIYSPDQIAAWRKQLLENAGEIFENGNPLADEAERRIRDLQAKVGEVTMERDFLSGALGRFGLPSAKR